MHTLVKARYSEILREEGFTPVREGREGNLGAEAWCTEKSFLGG